MPISDRARELFVAKLASRGVTPQVQDDGSYKLSLGEMTLTINLENKAREFDERGDEAVLDHFVEAILKHESILPTTWELARERVYLCVEPTDYDFGDTCRQEVSEQVCLILAYLAAEGQHVVWLTPQMLASLGVSRELAEARAVDNLARLLEETPIETVPAEGHTLAYLTTHSPLKASLIFARGLREKVEGVIGWPIYAVIPCRDFVYLIPQTARELFPGIAQVVIKEYSKRGYPISTEVYAIDEEKVEAIGTFQSPLNPPRGMKVVDHDALLTFFLPHAWEQDTDANGEPMYFDPDEEEKYLSVETQSYALLGGVPEGFAAKALASIAEEAGAEVEEWPGGRALVRSRGEDEEGELSVWSWAVAEPIDDDHLGLAVFTYRAPDDEATAARVEMLGEMLPRALFRPEGVG